MQQIPLFTLPIWQSKMPFYDEQNKEKFLDILSKYKEENPNPYLRNGVNSYQSPGDLHSVEELSSIFDYLQYVCSNAFLDLNLDSDNYQLTLASSWVNYNNSRASANTYHTHNGLFSGVIFLKCPEGSGNLCIFNTGMNNLWVGNNITVNKNQYTSEKVKFEPEEGDVFVWPSYMPHCVEPNNHDENRISISFECTIVPRQQQNVSSENQ